MNAIASAIASSTTPTTAGTNVSENGFAPVEQPPVQPEAADDHREHVRQVGQDEERDRLVGDGPLAHPRAAQRPGGEHEPARAAGREQARRRQPRHRDLVARRPADPRRRRARTRRGTSRRSRRTCRASAAARRPSRPAGRPRSASTCRRARRAAAAGSRARRARRAGTPPSATRLRRRDRRAPGAPRASSSSGGSGLTCGSGAALASCARPRLQHLHACGHALDQRRHGGRAAPDPLGEREPGGEVDDVVLAQVDERDAERAGVGPARPRRPRDRSRPAGGRP